MCLFFMVFLSVAVAITIAIPVAVAIAVAISVSAGMELHAVEHHAHIAELALVVDGLQLGELTAVELAGAHHKHREVGHTRGDGGVGHQAYGHGV